MPFVGGPEAAEDSSTRTIFFVSMRGGIAFSSVLCALIVILQTSTPSLAYDARVTLEFDTVTRGANATISVIVRNTWTRDIRINAINLTIDWPGGPQNRPGSGTPHGMGPGGAAAFDWPVGVPNTLHGGDVFHVRVDLNVTESTEQHVWANVSSSRYWILYITITDPVIVDGNDGQLITLPDALTAWLFISFLLIPVIVIVAVVVIVRFMKRKTQTPPPMQQPPLQP